MFHSPLLFDTENKLYRLSVSYNNDNFLHCLLACVDPEFQHRIWDIKGNYLNPYLDKYIKKFKKETFEFLLSMNNYLTSEEVLIYLKKYYEKDFYFDGSSGKEKLLNRIFRIEKVLGEPIYEDDMIVDFKPVIGIKNGYYYRTLESKYKLVNYVKKTGFNPNLNLENSDKEDLYQEFYNMDVDDPRNVFIPDIALKQFYSYKDMLYRPDTAAIFNIAEGNNFCLNLYDQVKFKKIVKYFVDGKIEYEDWLYKLIAISLDINIIIIKNTIINYGTEGTEGTEGLEGTEESEESEESEGTEETEETEETEGTKNFENARELSFIEYNSDDEDVTQIPTDKNENVYLENEPEPDNYLLINLDTQLNFKKSSSESIFKNKIKYDISKITASSPKRAWIILYKNNFYEPVAQERNGKLYTTFKSDDPLIQSLVETNGFDIIEIYTLMGLTGKQQV